jgi:hypothetical protein
MHHGFAHLTIKVQFHIYLLPYLQSKPFTVLLQVEEIDWASLAPRDIQSKRLLEEIMEAKGEHADDDDDDDEEEDEDEEQASPPPPPTA